MYSRTSIHFFMLVFSLSNNMIFLFTVYHLLISSFYSCFPQLSELSEIPAENIEFAKGKGTFPCDMSVLDIPNELDWSPRSGQLDQRPLYIMDDGAMIYYRWDGESSTRRRSGICFACKGSGDSRGGEAFINSLLFFYIRNFMLCEIPSLKAMVTVAIIGSVLYIIFKCLNFLNMYLLND